LLAALLATGPTGNTRPAVLVFSADESPRAERLLEELNIQLLNAAVVERHEPSERRQIALDDGTIAISIESTSVAGDLRVLGFVKNLSGALELGRLRSTGTVDEARAIALKARELFDVVRVSVERPEQPVPATHTSSAATISALFELGGFLGGGAGSSGVSGGALFSAGGRLTVGERRFDFDVLLRAPLNTSASAPLGTVVTEETDLGLGGAAFLASALGLGFGGEIAAVLRRLHATGTTSSGHTGAGDRALPAIGGAVIVDSAIEPWLEVRARLGAEVALVEERFALQGVTVQDYRRIRPIAQISLVLVGP
jgi:hypothetical protein